MKTLLAIDQGTTGTTAVLINLDTLEIVSKANKEFPQIFPKPGWVEHNLFDIWNTVKSTVRSVVEMSNCDPNQIQAIGITNQRETTCSFTRDGRPLHNAIVWQDRRTAQFCQSISQEQRDLISQKTGLPLDPYFSGTKMKWLLENTDNVQQAIKEDDCLFGTIDTYLIHKLSNGTSFVTEATNASRTLLFDLETGNWSSELCDFFKVPSKCLPEIKSSFDNFGVTNGLDFLPDGIPITGVLGDQQAALFGQAGFDKGLSKCTYGTGAFYLLNTGKDKVLSKNGLLTTVAFRENGEDYFALEGSSYIAGAAVQWLRDQLGIIENSPQIESLALKANDESCEFIQFLPFFSGIGSPYWVSEAKGALTGITRDTGPAQIARACLEGISLSIHDLIISMEKDSGIKVKTLKVDGGAVSNDFLLQIQANFSGSSIIRPKVIETTAFGAACAAAIGAKLKTKEDISNSWKEDKVFTPQESPYFINKRKLWEDTIRRLYL